MSDARNYSAGARGALFSLSSGLCFFPGCPKPVIEVTEGDPLIAVEIAHIKGANRTSARYEEEMSDDERSHFDNLMLLCTPHHKLIDGPRREEFPADLLLTWKQEHEAGQEVSGLDALSADDLPDLIQHAFAEAMAGSRIREIKVELKASLRTVDGQMLVIPLENARAVRLANGDKFSDFGLVTSIRNTGTLAASVSEIRLMFEVEVQGASIPMTLIGRNDFPSDNPPLPHRILDGASTNWLTKKETLAECSSMANPHQVSALYAQIILESGESIESPHRSWNEVEVALQSADS